jgi:hypothetical protein
VTLQELGNLGEFLGAVGVIVSLIYLATQIRQNTKSVRAAAIDAATDRFIESSRLISLNPELAELLEAGHKDYGALSHIQKRRYRLHYLANSLQFENMFRKYRDGLLPDSQWEGIAEALRQSTRQPGTHDAWKAIRMLIAPEFREFVDAMIERTARE